jgi:FkbM family methyltransferase
MDAFEINYANSTEYNVLEKFLHELKPDDVVWDIGANLGIYSLLAAKRQKVTIIAFEPHPTTVVRLMKNIKLNKFSNIQVFDIALSDSESKVDFFTNGIDESSGRAHITINKISGTIKVESSKGDTLIESGRVPKPDVVKIDVEGAEHLVIKGISKALSQCRVLFCEVHTRIEQYGSSGVNLESTLRNHGFTLENIQDRDDHTYTLLAKNMHLYS